MQYTLNSVDITSGEQAEHRMSGLHIRQHRSRMLLRIGIIMTCQLCRAPDSICSLSSSC